MIQTLYLNEIWQSGILFVNNEYGVWNLSVFFLRKHCPKYQDSYENQVQKDIKDIKTAISLFQHSILALLNCAIM